MVSLVAKIQSCIKHFLGRNITLIKLLLSKDQASRGIWIVIVRVEKVKKITLVSLVIIFNFLIAKRGQVNQS